MALDGVEYVPGAGELKLALPVDLERPPVPKDQVAEAVLVLTY